MNMRGIVAAVGAVALAMGLFAGCGSANDGSGASGGASTGDGRTETYTVDGAKDTIRIASGSENKEVGSAIEQAAKRSNVSVTVDYMGSLDIMDALRNKGHHAGRDYDAVWPASSMWITLGDTGHIVKDQVSTSTTPVVFGVKRSKAEHLGWADKDGSTKSVSMKDIIDAVRSGKLSFAMTSATQSNSGASAYMAFLTALRGRGAALTKDDLNDTALRSRMTALLSGVSRSSGSSDWLKDMLVNDPDSYDAMVNYESLVIQADKELTVKVKEPLLAIYPSDGIAIADSPLGYVNRGQGKERAFTRFSAAVTSKDAKKLFEEAGRRTGSDGSLAYGQASKVKDSFRKAWGIVTDTSVLRTIAMPSADVIEQALDLYQAVLRKPSYTLWVVDYSGSMSGKGKSGAVKGLQAALDTDQARASHIEPGDDDVNVFIPFNVQAKVEQTVRGKQTAPLLAAGERRIAAGGADVYNALNVALRNLPGNRDDYTVAIVLLTDGRSKTANRDAFTRQYETEGKGVPIFSVMFGDADSQQLDALAKLSNGKVFDGRTGDMSGIFREVKGYN